MSLITLHAKRGRTTITLVEKPDTKIDDLVAALAEALVATQEASNEDVASLKLGVEGKAKSEWTPLEEGSATLDQLKITETSVIGFAWGGEDFGYENFEDYDE